MTSVFVNGCFDLLHVDHVRFLQYAKSFGDSLIVGLNSDESIRRLKGSGRPIVGQDHRRELLLAIRWVDDVLIFSEDTPENLVRLLRPDVLVKGSHASNIVLPEVEAVKEFGGIVVYHASRNNVSSSSLIGRISDLS